MRPILISILFAAGVAFVPTVLAAADLERARDLYSRTDYTGSARLLNEAATDAAELRLLAQCRYMLGDPNRAATILEKAAALAPTDSMIQLWLGRAQGRRAETAFALRAPGLAVKAREAFEKAVKLDPKNREAVNDLFDYYMEAPGFLGGGPDKARALLPLLDQCDPAEAWHARSRLDEQKKDYAGAEAALRHAVEMEPANPDQMMNLARFFSRYGRHTESDDWSDRAFRHVTTHPRVLFSRAEIWVQAKRRLADARALLKKYLSITSLSADDPSRSDAAKLLEKAGGA